MGNMFWDSYFEIKYTEILTKDVQSSKMDRF